MSTRIRIFPAFTLVELLVVLVILSMLAGIVGPRVLKYIGSSKTDVAGIQIEELGASLDLFLLETGRYPSTSEGLDALVKAPPGLSRWNGPYLKKAYVPKDPWGFDYRYKSPGDHGPYDLFSLGADNKPGGANENEDVTSWTKK